MALKSDDILLVQRGDQSYQMPASQLTSSEVLPAYNLQQVTDAGNTTTKGATFGSDIICGANPSDSVSTNGVRVKQDGTLIVRNTSVSAGLLIYETGGSSSVISLNNDGSAQFGSTVNAVGDSAYYFVNRTATTASSALYLGQAEGTEVFKVGTDGGGDFAGVVNGLQFISDPTGGGFVGSRVSDNLPVFRGGSNNFNIADTNTYTSQIMSDGASTWDGQLTVGNATGTPGTNGVAVGPDGYISINWSTRANSNVITVTDTPNGDNTVEIKGSGNAILAGGVQARNYDATPAGSYWMRVFNGSGSNVNVLGYTDGSLMLGGTVDGSFVNPQNPNIHLKGPDGSAEFAGRVDANGGVSVNGGSSLSTGLYYRDDSETYGLALYSQGSQEVNRKAFIRSDGLATLNKRVSGTMTAIADNTAWDMTSSNFWTFAGGTLVNPNNVTAGQSGVIYVTAEASAYGNAFSFPGGQTPTIPANSVVPYFVDTDGKIRLGLATEAFV